MRNVYYCDNTFLVRYDVWPSPGVVHYIYTFGGSCPLTEFCHLQNSLCIHILRSPVLAALLHGTRAVCVSQTAAFNRGCHLYSARRPSPLASAHIVVLFVLLTSFCHSKFSCKAKKYYRYPSLKAPPAAWHPEAIASLCLM